MEDVYEDSINNVDVINMMVKPILLRRITNKLTI